MSNDLIDFSKVTTGNGFANDLVATTNDRLERTVVAISQLTETVKTENEKTRESLFTLGKQLEALNETTALHGSNTEKAIYSLINTIESLDEKNGKLQKSLYGLTIVASILGFIQVIAVIVQLYIQVKS